MEVRMIDVGRIRTDGPMPRAQMYPVRIADLRKALVEYGIDRMPPLHAFRDAKGELWLADGFHRLAAIKEIGWPQAQVQIHPGSERDARLFAAAVHTNLERNTADLHHAIKIILDDPLCAVLSHAAIGRMANCSPHVVAKVRDGKSDKMQVRRIGKRSSSWGSIERREKFHELAAKRMTVEEIAEELKCTAKHVTVLAKSAGLALPRRRGSKIFGRVDHFSMIEDTILQLEASTSALQSTGISVVSVPIATAADWAASLAGSLRIIRSLQTRLKQRAGYEEQS